MRDHFIETNGESITLKKINVASFDTYDQLDFAVTTFNDTTIKVLLSTGTAEESPKRLEGFAESQEELNISFKSDCTVAIGDYVEIDSLMWRVNKLNKRTYQGMSPFSGLISRT